MPSMTENRTRIVTDEEPICIDDKGYCKEAFLLPFHYEKDISHVLIPKGMILDRIEKMAYNISNFYRNKQVHLLCILKGSRAYFNNLLNTLNKIYLYNYDANQRTPYLEHYIRVKSYENESSTGKLTIVSDDLSVLKGQNILIVEDLIDTGFTLKKLCEWLEVNVKPSHIGVTCLLEKRLATVHDVKREFVGFSVPNVFIVGFGIDYNDWFRDLEHICVLKPDATKRLSIKS